MRSGLEKAVREGEEENYKQEKSKRRRGKKSGINLFLFFLVKSGKESNRKSERKLVCSRPRSLLAVNFGWKPRRKVWIIKRVQVSVNYWPRR